MTEKKTNKRAYTQVKFRLTEEELPQWLEKAKERSLSLPKFSKQIVQQALTQGKIKQPKIDKQQGIEMIHQFILISNGILRNNLFNQFVPVFFSHKNAPYLNSNELIFV